jgi:hypothetical protein
MAPQSASRGKQPSVLQSFPSPSTEIDAALRRTHPAHFIQAARSYLPAVSSSPSARAETEGTIDYANRSTTRLAALFSGVLALGIGYHLVEGRSLVGLSASVLAFTMLVVLVYQLLGGGNIGHRSFKEQGHFLCEAATADVLCDVMDGAQSLWRTFDSKPQRLALVAGTLVVGELLGAYLTAGRACIVVGVILVALAAAGGRKL